MKNSKNYFYSVIGIFLFFAFVGFIFPVPEQILRQLIEFIRELISQTEGMGHFELIRFIFFNNIQSSFFGMAFGALLGIFPVIATVTNGYLLGFVASLSVQTEGVFVLWRLLPHGIFELPAIFISLGLGLKLGTFAIQKDRFKFLKENFIESMKVFILVVVPLLILAAIIEGTLIFLTR